MRKAEEQLSRALTISVDHLGNENAKTLAIYNLLARSISQQGRFTESKQMFQVVLDLRRKSLGEEHPDTLREYDVSAGG